MPSVDQKSGKLSLFAVLGCTLLLIGLLGRLAIIRAASASAVDQHYWLLVAQAYREQRSLPVRIPGKYLMEDETQAYPPLFGMLLGRLSNHQILLYLVMPTLELAEFAMLGTLLHAMGVRWEMLLLALACYVAAPVLVVYNAQLTPRILGDFFLFSAMALQTVAVFLVDGSEIAWFYWGASAVLLGFMMMTHKMTLQLHLVLLPFWWWSLGAWQVPLATLTGFAVFFSIVGLPFGIYQFRAHWDIVRFWDRYWRDLGSHQFSHSPIYGDPDGDRSGCFHVPGWRGTLKHLRVVASYSSLNLVLPVCSLVSGVWPPMWILVWISGIYIWALATLFIPRLKCLGGGHLYVFNAIAPGSIYLAHLPATMSVFYLLVVGTLLTIISLVMAWRIVQARPIMRGNDFDVAIQHISHLTKAHFAVFPLQSAEAVAAQTDHAVLWGAHGYGFHQLEGFFPVLTQPLKRFFTRYAIDWVLWDSMFWPQGEVRLIGDRLVDVHSLKAFGRWRLARVSVDNL